MAYTRRKPRREALNENPFAPVNRGTHPYGVTTYAAGMSYGTHRYWLPIPKAYTARFKTLQEVAAWLNVTLPSRPVQRLFGYRIGHKPRQITEFTLGNPKR